MFKIRNDSSQIAPLAQHQLTATKIPENKQSLPPLPEKVKTKPVLEVHEGGKTDIGDFHPQPCFISPMGKSPLCQRRRYFDKRNSTSAQHCLEIGYQSCDSPTRHRLIDFSQQREFKAGPSIRPL